jgi:hypothetical protein
MSDEDPENGPGTGNGGTGGAHADLWERLRRPYEEVDTFTYTDHRFREGDGTVKAVRCTLPMMDVVADRLDEVVGPERWSVDADVESYGGSLGFETTCTLTILGARRTGVAHQLHMWNSYALAYQKAATFFRIAPSGFPTTYLATLERKFDPTEDPHQHGSGLT